MNCLRPSEAFSTLAATLAMIAAASAVVSGAHWASPMEALRIQSRSRGIHYPAFIRAAGLEFPASRAFFETPDCARALLRPPERRSIADAPSGGRRNPPPPSLHARGSASG